MIRKKKIVFLSTFLHSGLDWVHSLLDSHPEILITPALSFYRCWIKFGFKKFENSTEVYNKFYKYIKNNIGPECKNEQKKFLNTQEELDNFFLKFSLLLQEQLISRQQVFIYIHESYAYAKKINENKIKVIVAHETLPFYKKLFKDDFPNSRLILVLRDPRAALAGIWHRRIKLFGYLPDYTFNMTIDSWFYAVNFLKDKFYILNDNLYILKNEHLHNDLEGEMIKLTKWLKIDFNKSLLSETFPSGKNVFVDSAYLMNDRPNDQKLLHQNIPKDYFKIENVIKRWKDVLSKQQIIMIEGIFTIFFNDFGYKRIYRKNLINRFLSLVYFLFPQKDLMEYWLKNYPSVEAFERIKKRFDIENKFFFSKVWVLTPNFAKLTLLFLYSVVTRFKILLSTKENIPNYDKQKQNI